MSFRWRALIGAEIEPTGINMIVIIKIVCVTRTRYLPAYRGGEGNMKCKRGGQRGGRDILT